MNKLLLPVDGSQSAKRAVEYIMSLEIGFDHSEIHLLNVQPQIMAGEISHFLSVDSIMRARQAAGEQILQPVQAVLDAGNRNYTARVLMGKPAETIVRYAMDRGCDSIVMGTGRRSAIESCILGSVAMKVVSLANVPVTLVKPTSEGFAEIPALSRRARQKEMVPG